MSVDCCYGSRGNNGRSASSSQLSMQQSASGSRGSNGRSASSSPFDAKIQMVGQSRANGTVEGYLGSARRGQDPLCSSDCLEFLECIGFVFVGVTVFGFWLPSSADCCITDGFGGRPSIVVRPLFGSLSNPWFTRFSLPHGRGCLQGIG